MNIAYDKSNSIITIIINTYVKVKYIIKIDIYESLIEIYLLFIIYQCITKNMSTEGIFTINIAKGISIIS